MSNSSFGYYTKKKKNQYVNIHKNCQYIKMYMNGNVTEAPNVSVHAQDDSTSNILLGEISIC